MRLLRYLPERDEWNAEHRSNRRFVELGTSLKMAPHVAFGLASGERQSPWRTLCKFFLKGHNDRSSKSDSTVAARRRC
jgi:hypothetical protein